MKYLFAKIYNPLVRILFVILVILILNDMVLFTMGYIKDAFIIIDYIAVVSISLIIIRVALHLYISKIIRDQKKVLFL